MRGNTTKSNLKNSLKVEVSARFLSLTSPTIIDGCALLWAGILWEKQDFVKKYVDRVCLHIANKLQHNNISHIFVATLNSASSKHEALAQGNLS